MYDHGYGKKYRYHDSWGWVSNGLVDDDDDDDDDDDVQGICDILVPGEFITDDTLTILCEMTLPGNDVTKLGYTYNAEVESAQGTC